MQTQLSLAVVLGLKDLKSMGEKVSEKINQPEQEIIGGHNVVQFTPEQRVELSKLIHERRKMLRLTATMIRQKYKKDHKISLPSVYKLQDPLKGLPDGRVLSGLIDLLQIASIKDFWELINGGNNEPAKAADELRQREEREQRRIAEERKRKDQQVLAMRRSVEEKARSEKAAVKCVTEDPQRVAKARPLVEQLVREVANFVTISYSFSFSKGQNREVLLRLFGVNERKNTLAPRLSLNDFLDQE